MTKVLRSKKFKFHLTTCVKTTFQKKKNCFWPCYRNDKIIGGKFQDEEELVLATRLAVHGPISGPQASFPGMGGASGPLASLVGATGPSIMVPTAARPSPNEPLGPVNLLGPLSAAGPYSGLFTGTRWKPFPEVPPDHTSANHLLIYLLIVICRHHNAKGWSTQLHRGSDQTFSADVNDNLFRFSILDFGELNHLSRL